MMMKGRTFRTLVALAACMAGSQFAAAATQAPLASTTLSAKQGKDHPFDATITVDPGKTTDGRKSIAYHLVLNSKTCHSDVSGTVSFFSTTDDGGDDSSFLPNGYSTRINQYRGEGASGKAALLIDIESAHPRYVDITLTEVPPLAGSCIPKEGVGIDFYATKLK